MVEKFEANQPSRIFFFLRDNIKYSALNLAVLLAEVIVFSFILAAYRDVIEKKLNVFYKVQFFVF